VSDRGRVDSVTRTWKTARQKFGKTQLPPFIIYHQQKMADRRDILTT
jgi:hypothetical protein